MADPATTKRRGPVISTARNPTIPKITNPAAKTTRTSKTSQKLVVLPSEPQKRPLYEEEDLFRPDSAVEDYRSEAERMSKEQRHQAGYPRLTAYCVADAISPKLTTAFLKREHGVKPRVYDDAIYVRYQLPLLPGYVPSVNIRTSVILEGQHDDTVDLTEAEELGYEGTYFSEAEGSTTYEQRNGFVTSSPTAIQPSDGDDLFSPTESTAPAPLPEPEPVVQAPPKQRKKKKQQEPAREDSTSHNIAEVIVFTYGVVVFFGMPEVHERAVLEDLENAGVYSRKIPEDDWEVEECHFEHDESASKPRIYNDFFTLKSNSHLLKLSISHALAQSTLLARFESLTSQSLTDPSTIAIPRQLAATGGIRLRRRDAMRLTGRLFRLRRDVNLVSNVLDTPELFWSEASLKDLYDAVRDYMEITERVEVLNDKLEVVKDLLEMIHEHLNGNAMVRITWIIIWLIVVAIVVELGEALARVVVHASNSGGFGNGSGNGPGFGVGFRGGVGFVMRRLLVIPRS